MAVNIIEGNLLSAVEGIIGHQVNCVGVMGDGVAHQIKEKYPEVFKEYRKTCHLLKPKRLLGLCQVVPVGCGKSIDALNSREADRIIANLYGQKSARGFFGQMLAAFGIRVKYTKINALKDSLIQLREIAESSRKSVALPYLIGCARGGGNWLEVYRMIEEVFDGYSVTLYRLNK